MTAKPPVCGVVESFSCGYDHEEQQECECRLQRGHAGAHVWSAL